MYAWKLPFRVKHTPRQPFPREKTNLLNDPHKGSPSATPGPVYYLLILVYFKKEWIRTEAEGRRRRVSRTIGPDGDRRLCLLVISYCAYQDPGVEHFTT